jgi:hypothetical protein
MYIGDPSGEMQLWQFPAHLLSISPPLFTFNGERKNNLGALRREKNFLIE